tara:strand:- start:9498 stop:9896 length:399 start_codon:yes stop_codon:yes gene_type:complete
MPIVNGERYPYTEEGIEEAATDARFADGGTTQKDPVSQADVNEALGIIYGDPTGSPTDTDDRARAKKALARATPEQKARARETLNIPDGMNMGGVARDELGYMQGGMKFKERGAVKYSKGGAVKGKGFAGSF